MATNNQLNAPFPLAITQGGTGLASTTANQILYSSSTSVIGQIASANNGLLVTSAGGVPSIANTVGASITASGTVTSSGNFLSNTNAAGSVTNSFSTSIGTSNYFTYLKYTTGSAATISIQITVPAAVYFIGIEMFSINSRAPTAATGTSRLIGAYLSIGRNGSGSNVVLDLAVYAAQNFNISSTTAGGSQNATSGAVTITRNGAESSTSPQVVNININPATTGGSSGGSVNLYKIRVLGSLSGFSIT